MSDNTLFGLSAEFETPEALLAAAKQAKSAGYKEMKAYSPFAVHGMEEVLGEEDNQVGWVMIVMMSLGVIGAMFLQYWTTELHYSFMVGGRPIVNFAAWPAWTIIMFEASILFGGLAAVGYMFITTGLPAPYHPIFNTNGADGITYNRFFLCIEVTDLKFHLQETKDFLQGLEPIEVSEVAS